MPAPQKIENEVEKMDMSVAAEEMEVIVGQRWRCLVLTFDDPGLLPGGGQQRCVPCNVDAAPESDATRSRDTFAIANVFSDFFAACSLAEYSLSLKSSLLG